MCRTIPTTFSGSAMTGAASGPPRTTAGCCRCRRRGLAVAALRLLVRGLGQQVLGAAGPGARRMFL